MASFLVKTSVWLRRKLIVSTLIAVLGFAGGALWIFYHQRDFADLDREAMIADLSQKRIKLLGEKAEIERRRVASQAGVVAQKERAHQAEKVIMSLHEDESWWDRMWGNRAQQKTNDERLGSMDKLRTAALAQVTELTQTLSQTRWEKDGVEIALQRAESDLARLEAPRSKWLWWAQIAWDKSKWFIVVAVGLYFLGPLLWASMFATRRKPRSRKS